MQSLSLPIPVPPQADLADRATRSFESRVRAAGGAAGNGRREELRKAAEEFESLFVAYLFKVMRETLDEADSQETTGFGKSIYTELFDQEISRSVARRGALGIADVIMRGLERDDTKTPDPASGVPSQHPAAVPTTGDNGTADIRDTMMPVHSPISSGFGYRRDPFTREVKFHKGLDLAAPEGTAVQAVGDGEVTFAGCKPGYGKLVVVRHAGGLESRYAHLGKISVRTGDSIETRQSVGEVGSSGRSTAPHLHFEVVRWGVSVDPRTALGEVRAPHPNSLIDGRFHPESGD